MDLIGSFCIAFSLYSRIPMPQVKWTEKRMRLALLFFPLVGFPVGLGEYLLLPLVRLHFGIPAAAVCAALLPVFLTGGIHLDGYLDVTDALSSWQSCQRRLEILKDPHVGSFAVIGAASCLLWTYGLFTAFDCGHLPALLWIPVLCRALSGLCLLHFPKAKKDGLGATFADAADQQTVTAALLLYVLLSLTALFFTEGISALWFLPVLFWHLLRYHRIALRDFGGVTGDLAGWFLVRTEIGLLTVLVCWNVL